MSKPKKKGGVGDFQADLLKEMGVDMGGLNFVDVCACRLRSKLSIGLISVCRKKMLLQILIMLGLRLRSPAVMKSMFNLMRMTNEIRNYCRRWTR
jgi:hypothetical protein